MMINPIKQKITDFWLNHQHFSTLFYRKTSYKSFFKKIGDDAVNHPRKYVGYAVLGFIAFYITFSDYGIVSRARLEMSRSALQNELQEELKRSASLKEEIQNAKSLDTIEKIAREKYNFYKKGETVYLIK